VFWIVRNLLWIRIYSLLQPKSWYCQKRCWQPMQINHHPIYRCLKFHVDLHVTCNLWNIDIYSRGKDINLWGMWWRLILTRKETVSSETSAHFYQRRRRHTPAEVIRSFVAQTSLITMFTKDSPGFYVQWNAFFNT
jgi:hypothetical protein